MCGSISSYARSAKPDHNTAAFYATRRFQVNQRSVVGVLRSRAAHPFPTSERTGGRVCHRRRSVGGSCYCLSF